MAHLSSYVVCFLLVTTVNHARTHDIYIPDLPSKCYQKHGDFNLGVLFPVHVRKAGLFCGNAVQDLGALQRLEAIVFAIDQINEATTILDGYTLGFVMFDDCMTDITALAQSMHFVRTSPHASCSLSQQDYSYSCNDTMDNYDIIGLLGTESSITTIEAAKMMTTFRIPHVSYIASSPSLSDLNKFPLFQRTVPSDVHQVKAIIALLKQFQWSFVDILYSSGEYGEQVLKSMVEETDGTNICFNIVRELKDDMTFTEYRNLVKDIIYDGAVNVSVVLVFAPLHKGRHQSF